MTQAKQQDKIQEIMGLIQQGRMASYLEGLNAGMENYSKSREQLDIVHALGNTIQSKLRELVREPLSVDCILSAFRSSVFVDNSQLSAFASGVRCAERAHNITSTSK